jgi:capsular polysaccharide transport system permease protein
MTETEQETETLPPRERSWSWSRGRAYIALVVLPALLALGYLLLVASPQYVSRTAYMIRGIKAEPAPASGLGALLGAAQTDSAREAGAVRDFLTSPDAIAALKARGVDVKAQFTAPGIDWFSRLRPASPRAETLLDYYREKVSVEYDKEAGLTRIAVRAFAPDEAQKLAAALVALGEARVNTFNQRALASAVGLAEQDLAKAEDELARIQGELTSFRDISGEIDPAKNSEGENQQLRSLEAQLGRERAELASMSRFLTAGSPQVQLQQSRVGALEAEVARIKGRITGSPQALSRRLSGYEQLKLRQDFAAKSLQEARSSLLQAREQAGKERLFFVEVVKPNLPEKPAYPRPWRTALTLFLALSVAFAIGWLILAGVREHQAA